MKVTVEWLKSPRRKYGIPRAPGSFSVIDVSLAKKIRAEDPDMFRSYELDNFKEKAPEVKDTMQKKVRTRPVEK